nr:nitrous oxide reductase maturation protein [uncultured bacterium]
MVSLQGLEKSFAQLEVLKGIDASFEAGKITAVIGPNASGKSTLMKSILGLVLPDKGNISVHGQSYQMPESRALVGYMPQRAQFPDNLKPQELFHWVQELRAEESPHLEELIDYFELRPHMDQPLRVLSGGTRQKVSAVIAFLFDPPVLILDEPTAGLDPRASSRLKDKIMVEKARGKTIILTSHVMSELEELTDEVLFLLEGEIVFSGTLEQLRGQTGEDKLERAIAMLMEDRAQ